MEVVDLEGQSVWRGCLGLLSGAWLWLLVSPIIPLLPTVHRIDIFIVIGVLAVAQWQPYRWIRLVAACVTCVSVLVVRFAPSPRHIVHSVIWLARVLWHDGYLGLRGQPAAPVLILAMMLVAVSLTCWLVHYVSLRPRLWIFYCALGLLVLGSLDGRHLVLLWQLPAFLCVSLGVLALRRFTELFADAHPMPGIGPMLGFLAPAVAILIACSGLALLFPKPQAVSAYLSSEAGRYRTGHGWSPSTAQRAGYSLDNSDLGGSFEPGSGSVLEVATTTPAYLRGAVYTTYTGHGWALPVTNRQVTPQGQAFSSSGTFAHLPTTKVRQTITVLQDLAANVLFGGYAMTTLEPSKVPDLTSVAVDSRTHAVFTQTPLLPGATYTVVSNELQDPGNAIAKIPIPSIGGLPRNVRADLQLPSTLPTRIQTFAQSLTAGKKTEYGEVMAVVNDLRLHYTYQTTNIPRPQPGQDYVDEFLFQSKRGYCDNFSSAAAVMLRTIGIPTRWVTGFTEGTSNGQVLPDGTQQYVVSANDAHAWIEVYFPHVGWVPFDATPGFHIPTAPGANDQQQGGGKVASPTPGSTTTQILPNQGGSHPHNPSSPSGSGRETGRLVWGWVGAVVLAAIVAAAVIWRFRRRIGGWLSWFVMKLGFARVPRWWMLSRARRRLRRWLRLPDTPRIIRDNVFSNRDHVSIQSSPTTLRLHFELRRELGRLIARLRREGFLPRTGAITLRDVIATAPRCGVSSQASVDVIRTAEQALYGNAPVDEPMLREAIQIFRTWMNVGR